MNDIFKDKIYKKMMFSQKYIPGISTDIVTIHNYLNQISEFLIFTYLKSMKNQLNYPETKINENHPPNPPMKFKLKNFILKTHYFDTFVVNNPQFQLQTKFQTDTLRSFFRCIYDTLDEALQEYELNSHYGI